MPHYRHSCHRLHRLARRLHLPGLLALLRLLRHLQENNNDSEQIGEKPIGLGKWSWNEACGFIILRDCVTLFIRGSDGSLVQIP